MAATTLTAIPATFRAGDTLLLSINLSDYPASDSWELTYTFRRPDGADITFASEADGDLHSFEVAYGDTAQWTPGIYNGQARVDNGTQGFTVWTGAMEILPDLAAQPENFDGRSHARICLEAIEAVIEGRITTSVINTTIAGQSVTRLTPAELMQWRNYYLEEVRREDEQLAVDQGKNTGRNVMIRFLNPS